MSAENPLQLLGTAEYLLRETSDPKDQKYADIIAGVLSLRGADVNYAIPQNGAPSFRTSERTLGLLGAEYKKDPTNPILLSEFNQAFWNAKRQAMGVNESDLVVTQAPYSEDQIRKFISNDFGLFLPQICETAPEGLVLLGKAFPEMGSSAFMVGTPVLNIDRDEQRVNLYGWMKTEKAINAPNLRTNESQALAIVNKKKRLGQTLNIYAVAGQQSKLLADQYLDEVSTWVRVLSSRVNNKVVHAGFHPNGDCLVRWSLGPENIYDNLGVRCVGV